MVEKRNARERLRVQAVNKAFTHLRGYIPTVNQTKRTSKVIYILAMSLKIFD